MKKYIIMLLLVLNTLVCSAQVMSYDDMFNQAFGSTPKPKDKEPKNKRPINETRQYESGGFEWIELSQWSPSDGVYYYGAKDANGKTIIPLSAHYTSVYFAYEAGYMGYFRVETKSGKVGARAINGSVILPAKYDGVGFSHGRFEYKLDSKWNETRYGLTASGKVTGKSSSDGSNSNYYSDPYYPSYDGGGSYNSGGSVGGNNPQNTLNQTAGEKCLTCKGTGKCPTCKGSKTASSMGNTYKCNVCDANGNCPSCHGSGKASWNR